MPYQVNTKNFLEKPSSEVIHICQVQSKNRLLQEPKEKKRVYHIRKKGQGTQEVFKDVVRSCRKKTGEANTQLELNLATSVKDNKKCFYKYINSKTRSKDNLHSLLDAGGNTVTKDEEKAEVLNTFFASVFKNKIGGPQNDWPPELVDRDGEQNGSL